MDLKRYQNRALADLKRFLKEASAWGPKHAFIAQTERPYVTVPRLSDPPYVCLRIPTGGGKTLMASHAVGIAAQEYVQSDRVVVLWLVPSNAILRQTLTALKNRNHPYRRAIESSLTGPVTVMNLEESLEVSAGVLAADNLVLVSTLAALRVEDTEGRKIYEANGALMAHFDNLTEGEKSRLETGESSQPRFSLANVIRLHRPIVVMDEAHNARTPLSFESLERLDPSVILEFTATPALGHEPERGRYASNVLHHCSARELKAEEMIKLPIELHALEDPQDVIAETIALRHALEELAKKEEAAGGRYLRPVALFQAERRSQKQDTITVDRVRELLLEDFQVPEEHVAIEAYDTHDLADEDVLARDCAIRFIITQQKLREGWDCPFAYILASVASQQSSTAVEQILGRVLRMPYVKRREHDELNRAYALVSSQRFQEAAVALRDALVDAGFEQLEAHDFVCPSQRLLVDDLPLFNRTIPASSEVGSLSIPALSLEANGQLEILEQDHLLGVDWTLAQNDGELTEAEFPEEAVQVRDAEIDIDEDGRLQTYLRDYESRLHGQMQILGSETSWSQSGLAVWLDRRLPDRQDLTQGETLGYLGRVIEYLVTYRQLELAHLGRHRYRLLKAVSAKINHLRELASGQMFSRLLAGSATDRLAVDSSLCFEITSSQYAPSEEFSDRGMFSKHAFDVIADFDTEPEMDCAFFLDHHSKIDCWIRNIARRPRESFWLQTSTDKFYPDFVTRLTDDRILVVEVKSERDWSNDDSKEKRRIGEIWAELSAGQCLFVMPKGTDWSAIESAISDS